MNTDQENYMEIGYSGWFMPSRRPMIGGATARYDAGKQEKSSESQQSSKSFIPAQEDALKKALAAFTEQGRIGSGQEQFPGQRVVGMTDLQNQIVGETGNFMDTFSASGGTPFFGEMGSALQGLLSGETGAENISSERANEIFSASRQTPAEDAFTRFTKP